MAIAKLCLIAGFIAVAGSAFADDSGLSTHNSVGAALQNSTSPAATAGMVGRAAQNAESVAGYGYPSQASAGPTIVNGYGSAVTGRIAPKYTGADPLQYDPRTNGQQAPDANPYDLGPLRNSEFDARDRDRFNSMFEDNRAFGAYDPEKPSYIPYAGNGNGTTTGSGGSTTTTTTTTTNSNVSQSLRAAPYARSFNR